jgi:hypothetical protein
MIPDGIHRLLYVTAISAKHSDVIVMVDLDLRSHFCTMIVS